MPRWRIAVGKFWHESNSFNSVPTPLSSFTAPGAYSGVKVAADCLPELNDRNSELAGMLQCFATQAGSEVEVVPLLSAGTMPSGLWEVGAVHHFENLLRAQLQAAMAGEGALDGVCFATHGAMASAIDDDLDGRLLALIHEVCPGVPITVGLDLHAVVTPRMVQHTIAALSYKTHPHLDLWETGYKAADILLGALAGRTSPVQSMVRVPMLFADCGTNVGEMARIFSDVELWETEDPRVLSLSLNMAFPSLDASGQGWTAVAVVDGDQAVADALAARLAARCWEARVQLWDELEKGVPMADALAQAAALGDGPVVITDAADNVGGGTPGDTPDVLRQLLTHARVLAPNQLAMLHIPDPEAVAAVLAQQQAAATTSRSSSSGYASSTPVKYLKVGGKTDPLWGRPVTIENATLLAVAKGPIRNCAPGGGAYSCCPNCICSCSSGDSGRKHQQQARLTAWLACSCLVAFGGTGPTVDTGRLVCLGIGKQVRLVLSELKVQGPHVSIAPLSMFHPIKIRQLGTDSEQLCHLHFFHQVSQIALICCSPPFLRQLGNGRWMIILLQF